MTQQEKNMMALFFDFVKKQGFYALLMGIGIWWLNNQYQVLFDELESCQQKQIELLKTVVKDNTRTNVEIYNYLKHKELQTNETK